MRFLSASHIHPVSSPAFTDHVLLVEDDGKIAGLLPASEVGRDNIEHFDGALVPGFVNAHCHLELSHLRGLFPEKTGLPDFLNKVVSQREADAAEVSAAMLEADREMQKNGIVAVGDICNKADSFPVKAESQIYYHSFVELLAFNPDRAEKALGDGNLLLQQLSDLGLPASLVPHAPYSVSPALLYLITRQCAEAGQPTSIHMMESNDETEFFVQGTGLYRRLYHDMGMDIDFFEPSGTTSLDTLLPWMHPQAKTLLVHNTIATTTDAEQANSRHKNLWWCFCPNANLYIEDRLPDVPQLTTAIDPDRISLGTDSLASNHGLSIYNEMQVLLTRFPSLTLDEVLPWATLNGARFLGIDSRFGTFETGKQPGVVHLSSQGAKRII